MNLPLEILPAQMNSGLGKFDLNIPSRLDIAGEDAAGASEPIEPSEGIEASTEGAKEKGLGDTRTAQLANLAEQADLR